MTLKSLKVINRPSNPFVEKTKKKTIENEKNKFDLINEMN